MESVVFGCSPDSTKSHRNFIARRQLGVDLLADPGHSMMEEYGAWGKKSIFGIKSVGTIRSTVLIDPWGRIAFHWAKVKSNGHAAEVLAKLKAFRAAAG